MLEIMTWVFFLRPSITTLLVALNVKRETLFLMSIAAELRSHHWDFRRSPKFDVRFRCELLRTVSLYRWISVPLHSYGVVTAHCSPSQPLQAQRTHQCSCHWTSPSAFFLLPPSHYANHLPMSFDPIFCPPPHYLATASVLLRLQTPPTDRNGVSFVWSWKPASVQFRLFTCSLFL